MPVYDCGDPDCLPCIDAFRKDAPRDWLIDHLENVITDSIDVDWTPKAAATAVHDEVVGPLVEALLMISTKWAGHSQACRYVLRGAGYGKPTDCDCDWPKVKRQVDAALRAAGHPDYTE